MTPVERLFLDQKSLQSAIEALHAICTSPEPPLRESLAQIRWTFARTLMRHLQLKDRVVYARLRNHPDPLVQATGERFRREAFELYARFEQHSERWTADAVAADWQTYRAMAAQMIRMLNDRVAREEAELLPHLDSAPDLPVLRTEQDHNWAAAGWKMRAWFGVDREEEIPPAAISPPSEARVAPARRGLRPGPVLPPPPSPPRSPRRV